ncbi:MAG: fibronectin type III domain-containing protein [Eubacterium sp.]|nr:fibronectin type III domain-containing protein [Eubacterium sp.]
MSSYLVADKTIRDAPTFTLTEAKTEGGKNVNVDFNACPDEYLRGGRLVKYATEPGETEKTYYLGPNQNLCTPEAGKYYYIMSVEVEGSGAFIDADSEIVIDGNKWTFVSESDNMYAIKSPDFNLTPIIDNVSLTSNLSSVMKFKNSTDTSLVSITGNNNKISVSNIRYHKRQGKTDTYSNISTETEFVHNYYKAVAELNVNPDYLSKAKFADNLVVYVDGIPWDVYNVSESSVTIRSRAVLIRDPASEIKTIKATSNLKKFNAEGCSTSGGVSFSSITTDFKRCAVKVDFKCYPEGDNNYNGKYGTFVRLADSTNKKELRFNDYDNPSNLPAGTYCYETTVTVSASEITPYIPYVDDNTEFIIDGKNWRIIGELGDDILIIRSPEFVIEHIWGEPVTVARNIKKYTCQKCNAVKVVAFGNYYVTEADAKEVAASERLTKRKPKTPTVSRKGKKMTVKWKKVADASGYQIQYSTNKKFKKAKTVNVKGSKASKKQIKKLKNNKKYYVRVRAYRTVGKVNGKTVGKSVGKTVGAKYGKTVQRTVGKDYSKWSKTKVVKSK